MRLLTSPRSEDGLDFTINESLEVLKQATRQACVGLSHQKLQPSDVSHEAFSLCIWLGIYVRIGRY